MKNKTSILIEPSIAFLKFVRAKMQTKAIRKDDEESKSVQILLSDIERFFPYPKFNKKVEIQILIDLGELKVTTVTTSSGYKAFCYEAKPGAFDLSLLKPEKQNIDSLTEKIRSYLKLVSLPKDAPSTPYFDLFIMHCNQYIDIFFSVDNFSGRIHTPVSSFHRTHRPNILLNSQPVVSFDVAQSQPTILSKILKANIGDNAFSSWINSGKDVYTILQEKAVLKDRDEAKNLFYLISFSKPNDRLNKYFGESEWINWINKYKSSIDSRNPKHKTKPHSNMAWMLQMTEVLIMRKIWKDLANKNIPFLTVHDEIICCQSDATKVQEIMDDILSKEYPVYKLNISHKPLFEKSSFEQLAVPKTFAGDKNIKVAEPAKKCIKQEVLKLENLELDTTKFDYTSVNNQIKEKDNTAYLNSDGKLFIETPYANTFTVFNSISDYNERKGASGFENKQSINTDTMTAVHIDPTTLKIEDN